MSRHELCLGTIQCAVVEYLVFEADGRVLGFCDDYPYPLQSHDTANLA